MMSAATDAAAAAANSAVAAAAAAADAAAATSLASNLSASLCFPKLVVHVTSTHCKLGCSLPSCDVLGLHARLA